MNENVLMHWGKKGMKWGVRRYQNKDGTLTPAGKKRYAQEMERLKKEEKILKNKQRTKAQLDKLSAKEQEIKAMKKEVAGKKLDEPKVKPTPKKTVKDMTDEELNAAVNRMRLEKTYKELMTEQNAAAKKANTSKGKAFVDSVWKNSLKPGLTEAGKEAVKKSINMVVDETINDIKKKKRDQ